MSEEAGALDQQREQEEREQAHTHGGAHPSISIKCSPLVLRPSTRDLELSIWVYGAVEGFSYQFDVLVVARIAPPAGNSGCRTERKDGGHCLSATVVATGSNTARIGASLAARVAFRPLLPVGDQIRFVIRVYDAFPGLAAEEALLGTADLRLRVPTYNASAREKRDCLHHCVPGPIGLLPQLLLHLIRMEGI